MAKRPTMEVDEEYLRDVMAGGIVRPKKEERQAEPTRQPVPVIVEKLVKEETENMETDDREVETPETKEPVKQTRKKREMQDYESVFLQKQISFPRCQAYISTTNYDKIMNFLPVVAREVSITVYLDNILTHHLEQYKDDINGLYALRTKKPLE